MKDVKAINRISRSDLNLFKKADCGFGNALDQYQTIAVKSAIYPGRGTPFGLMYVALGLAEAGEVQNKVKKAFRDDGIISFADWTSSASGLTAVSFDELTTERRKQIMKELGGALWYLAAVCDELGVQLSEVATMNLEELCSRGERGTLSGDGDDR